MDRVNVEMAAVTVTVNVIDGVPQCNCCQAPMVRVDERRWMCQIGHALQGMFHEALERYESALARP